MLSHSKANMGVGHHCSMCTDVLCIHMCTCTCEWQSRYMPTFTTKHSLFLCTCTLYICTLHFLSIYGCFVFLKGMTINLHFVIHTHIYMYTIHDMYNVCTCIKAYVHHRGLTTEYCTHTHMYIWIRCTQSVCHSLLRQQCSCE